MFNEYKTFAGYHDCNIPTQNPYHGYFCPYWTTTPTYIPGYMKQPIMLRDYGPNPFVIDIKEATLQNETFRTALWTGKHLQLTLMSIGVGEDIGLEIHPELDQFLRVEQGQGLVMMGDSKNNLNFRQRVYSNCIIIIPAGKWHNVYNTGRIPLKLYSIYAPPAHPHGTVHKTKQDAEEHHGH
ncbi:MAG TPA: cupin domain-containing protein [Clostridiaceae bacterium]|nr:cupin domain-containing protein [Clostridiaceae bacterium]